MDDPLQGKLIGAYGYCTQELVNLILIGKSTSNVFDGEIRLDGEANSNSNSNSNSSEGQSGMLLKGIQARSQIGYLTQMEKFGYCQVCM